MTATVTNSAPEIEIRVKYIHPGRNKTGSFGILPESDELTERFRSRYGITTEWMYVRDRATGMNLKAFRPIEPETLDYVKELGILDGQVCVVTQKAVRKGGRMVWRFVDIRSV